jgi:glycerol transport system ATP-binding protein
LTPQQRNIAQVFQFPVIYDTMTVGENLAFPLRNRQMPREQIRQRVGQIAEMLELNGQLNQRAAGLSADAKQKISLGRGLVRPDVAAILFDEPLTVIDPHLKWQLRRKLKQVHQELKHTLIYVTHDQVEALTFAQEVVVMTRGRAVQVGSAEALFERPAHTFVGHFIGSPGMNFLPAVCTAQSLHIGASQLALPPELAQQLAGTTSLKLGVRPEHLHAGVADNALQTTVTFVESLGSMTYAYCSNPGLEDVITCAVEGERPVRTGSVLPLGVPVHKAYLFDAQGKAFTRLQVARQADAA